MAKNNLSIVLNIAHDNIISIIQVDNCSNYVSPNYAFGDYIDYNCRILFIVQIVYIYLFNEWIGMSNSTNDKELYKKYIRTKYKNKPFYKMDHE